MKRLIWFTSLWIFAASAIAQAPGGVCISNVAQTISNGVIAPIPYATIALCSAGSTATNCIANKVNIYTSTALSTATPTNPFTADAGGNYFFCAADGQYALLISSTYGTYFVPSIKLVDNWAAGGTITGNLIVTGTVTGGHNGNLTGNASTASASNHSPTQCTSGLYSQGDTAAWAANCAQVQYSQLGAIPALVTSFNTRTGSVTLATADVDAVGNITNSTSGNAALATALAAAGTTLASPAVAKGVDASGNAIAQTFTGSLSSNGYMTLPSGLILQWGSLAGLPDNAALSTSLPYTFPHACFEAFANEDENATVARAGNPRTIAADCTTSTVTLWASGSGSTGSWFAIGY